MKLNFLSLCLSALVLLVSCKKQDVPPPGGSNQVYPSLVSVTASDWRPASTMIWSDASASAGAYLSTEWSTLGLTEEVIAHNAVLIYAKATSSEAPKLLPATFETSNSETDIYNSIAGEQTLQLFHSRYINGVSATATVDDNISFRYILIGNMPSASSRIATNNGIEFSFDELKLMSYNEVATILGIAD